MSAALSAQDVSVERGRRRVLEQFSLSAQPGTLTALIGPNGAGKSTALKALSGLLAYRGSVRIAGVELAQLSLRERARRRAYVPQQSLLASGIAVREIVLQGRYAHTGSWQRRTPQPAVERALAATRLHELAERRWDQLSGGEQRRVLLARALATEASVVLLDEPTAGLDLGHGLRFLGLLRALAADGLTVVLVLHDLEQALRYADSVLLLARGRIVAQGSAREVISPAIMREVYGVELLENTALGFRLVER